MLLLLLLLLLRSKKHLVRVYVYLGESNTNLQPWHCSLGSTCLPLRSRHPLILILPLSTSRQTTKVPPLEIPIVGFCLASPPPTRTDVVAASASAVDVAAVIRRQNEKTFQIVERILK